MDYKSLNLKPVFKPIKGGLTSPVSIDEWDHVLYWNQQETIKKSTPENIKNYMEDTYNLIKYYASETQHYLDNAGNVTLQPIVDYGAKYGIPFGNGKTTEIKLFEILKAFDDMAVLIDIFSLNESRQEKIDYNCALILNAIKHEHAKGTLGDYTFITTIISKQDVSRLNPYIISNTNSQTDCIDVIYNCHNDEYYKNNTVPINKIRCSIDDIETLTNGTYNEKIAFLKGRLLEGFTQLLNDNKPQFNMTVDDKGSPIIELLTDNHLIYFLFTWLTDNEYNICPECKKLLINGNKWCSGRKCMELYLKKTPEGRMKNMINNWRNRDKIKITSEQQDELEEEGIKLLKQYSYEIVRAKLQEMKKQYI